MKTWKLLFRAFAWDWLSVLVCLALVGGLHFVPPFVRYYFPDDQSIAYPLVSETVPTWALGIISILVPIILICAIWRHKRGSLMDLHHSLLGLALSVAITLLITQILKLSVGRLRPDFLARCQPISENSNAPCGSKDESLIIEGRKSFPSGHASTAFAGLGYLSLYLAGKLNFNDGQGHTYRLILVGLPLISATLIAVSRVDDYYHHWQDVTVGSILGMVFAWISYRQYYPPLNSNDVGSPKNYRLVALPFSNESAANSDNSFPSASPSAEPLQILVS